MLVTSVDRSRLPLPGPDPSFRIPVVRRFALANGLRVWTVEQREVPVVSFLLLLTSGASADPVEHPGLAALTADLMDEGSGDRSAIDIEDALARLGAQLETEVGSDATVLSLLTLGRFRDDALALLADIVARPRLSETDFTRLRDLRLTRLLQLRDLPPAVADRTLTKLLYPEHPYGHLPMGTAEGLREVTLDEVRAHHACAWRPSRLTLIAVGDATHKELLASAERAFGAWSPAATNGRSSAPSLGPEDRPAAVGPLVAIVDRPGAAQSEVRIGQVALPRQTPDYHALLVLNAILGGQFVSRLNMNLREDKGYTYGARSGFEFRRAPGPFVVQVAVQTSATADAVREALGEIEAIGGERPATSEELELARSALTRGYPRNFETAGQVARSLAQLALYGLPHDTFEQFVPAVAGVGIEDVTAGARRLDRGRMVVAIVGDRERVAEGLAGLGLGEPKVVAAE
ncbi:MAG: insulinase family protein [Acidobacteria bacterium]|nr:MAG: insulinase family protein [Acidobacteriota bacterium]